MMIPPCPPSSPMSAGLNSGSVLLNFFQGKQGQVAIKCQETEFL